MGYMRHHAIAFTSYEEGKLLSLHALAIERAPKQTSAMLHSPINDYVTFFLAPDGSKEGWDQSDQGDDVRAVLIEEAKKSPGIDFVEVIYGGDEQEAYIVNAG